MVAYTDTAWRSGGLPKSIADYTQTKPAASPAPAPDPVVQQPVPTILPTTTTAPAASPAPAAASPAPAPAAAAPATAGSTVTTQPAAIKNTSDQPGLIAGAMKKTDYNPDNIQVASAGVSNWNVNDDQLVEKRANNIIASDSPLMQQARARALMDMNDRGMTNSSFAVGAAHGAVMDRAIDIGGRDAATYAQSAQFNADSANKASMFNAGQTNQWNSNKLDKDWASNERLSQNTFTKSERVDQNNFTKTERQDQNAFTQAEKQKEREANIEQYKFQAGTEKELKELGFKYQKELNDDDALNRNFSQYMDEISRIDADPNLDAPAKERLKYEKKAAFEGFAKMRGLKLDLNFDGGTGGTGGNGGKIDYTKPENQTQENFDEAAYYAANPDLLQKGWDRGAWAHYQMYGKGEGRKFTGKA